MSKYYEEELKRSAKALEEKTNPQPLHWEKRKDGFYELQDRVSEKNGIVCIPDIYKIPSKSAREYIKKCLTRIDGNDYSGAITTSRSLVEGVIKEIYHKITGKSMRPGKLPKDWRNLAELLTLHPEKKSNDALESMLNAITSGLAAVRNALGDAHGHADKPDDKKTQQHDALLAVNSALTVAIFLFDTYEHQVKNGNITPQND